MKKLTLYKNASDFAFASIEITHPANFDVAAAQEFQKAGFDSVDYLYWRQTVTNLIQNFRMLNTEPAQSEMNKPKVIPTGPVPRTIGDNGPAPEFTGTIPPAPPKIG